ncbi:MAG: hypothetical protein ACAI35_06590 [Candidatus Methylacidiphilales bacterium]|nr:hypothetical protein [Candidatus Methylacidiphilales bacterium]
MSEFIDTDVAEAEMAARDRKKRLIAAVQAGMLLTIANFLASLGHFVYQIYCKPRLESGEFSLFNTTLILVQLLTVPLAAGSQAFTHFISKHHGNDNHEELHNLQDWCQMMLRRYTWWLCVAALIVIHPLTIFFNFPRDSLTLVALACVPLMLWSILGTVMLAGLSRFELLAGLTFGTMLVRFISGAVLIWFFPFAEAAACATLFACIVLALPVLMAKTPRPREMLQNPWTPEFSRYLAAALCVGVATFIFTQADLLIAQRCSVGVPNIKGWVPSMENISKIRAISLDMYTAAGLLGRAILMGATPILVVYFTKRSQGGPGQLNARALLAIYFILIIIGSAMLTLLREPLSLFFVRSADPEMMERVRIFALAMIPIGIVQGVGYYLLATSRLLMCYIFGGLGLLYLFILGSLGTDLWTLQSLMCGGSAGALCVLYIVSIVRHSWTLK